MVEIVRQTRFSRPPTGRPTPLAVLQGQRQKVESGEIVLQQQREQAKLDSLISGARRLKSIKDPTQQMAELQRRRADLVAQGVDTGETDQGIELLQQGDLEGFNQSLDSILSLEPQGQFTLSPGQTRFSGGQQIASVAAAPTKPTSLERNLELAGLVPGSPAFQEAALKGATRAPSVIIGGAKKEQEALATGRVSQLNKFRDEREASIDTNQSLDILENIDVNTGALEPAKQAMASFGKAFGIDTSGLATVAGGEAFNAVAQRIVLSVKASQKGPQTDKDEATIRDTVASLGNTKEGNQFIIDSAKALNNRKIERADFFDAFLEDNETLKGANRDWAKFKRQTPMVSRNLRTPEGLPVFFFKFERDVRSANPNANREEILEFWRQNDKKKVK